VLCVTIAAQDRGLVVATSLRPLPIRACAAPSVPRVAEDRRRALGQLGERIAREHLAARGFAVVDSNFRTRWGELDVVAASDRVLVFCEVKTRVGDARPGPFAPLAAVGGRKQRQVRRMARQWLGERSALLGVRPTELRFDAIGVTLDGSGRLTGLEHVEDAF
jgi:putative endonuclease